MKDEDTFRRIFGLTPEIVFHRMSPSLDILEVASPCFQEGSFTLSGNIKEHCGFRCRTEFLCEVIAAHILMPELLFLDDLKRLPAWIYQGNTFEGWVTSMASRYEVEAWAVRFRICLLDDNYFSPYRTVSLPAA